MLSPLFCHIPGATLCRKCAEWSWYFWPFLVSKRSIASKQIHERTLMRQKRRLFYGAYKHPFSQGTFLKVLGLHGIFLFIRFFGTTLLGASFYVSAPGRVIQKIQKQAPWHLTFSHELNCVRFTRGLLAHFARCGSNLWWGHNLPPSTPCLVGPNHPTHDDPPTNSAVKSTRLWRYFVGGFNSPLQHKMVTYPPWN